MIVRSSAFGLRIWNWHLDDLGSVCHMGKNIIREMNETEIVQTILTFVINFLERLQISI